MHILRISMQKTVSNGAWFADSKNKTSKQPEENPDIFPTNTAINLQNVRNNDSIHPAATGKKK